MVKLNERGRANLNAIMAGFVADQAAQWPGARAITIAELPTMRIRSAWAATAAALNARELADMWRELGDGAYLMTVEGEGRRERAVVDVVDGVVYEQEPVTEDQVALLPELYALVVAGEPVAAPAEVVAVTLADGTEVVVE